MSECIECGEPSVYLMPMGNLCREHMAEHYPDVMGGLDTILGKPKDQTDA